MYHMILENQDGDKLEFNGLKANYNLTNAQGLSPASATINTNSAALLDGATFNSSKVEMRTINLAFTIEYPVEQNRLAVYKVLRPKKSITLYYKSNLLDVFIDGYVESVDVGHFSNKQKATVSIICPSPYFKSAQSVVNELSSILSLFHFPFQSQGGKNLLPNVASTSSVGGITFTVNADGSITADGTATENVFLHVGDVQLNPNYTYLLNGCPENGGLGRYIIYLGAGGQIIDSGNGVAYRPVQAQNLAVAIEIFSGVTVSDLVFKPMVRYATYVDSNYQPYGFGEIVFGEILSMPMAAVPNNGGIETGLIFELYTRNAVTNPKIWNYVTQEFLEVDFEMQTGDTIRINTIAGQKSITLIRNAVETNLFNYLARGSTWLQLASNGSLFVYELASGSIEWLEITVKHFDLYEGV